VTGAARQMLYNRTLIEAALPQYEVGTQLGEGGFGVVLAGRHRRLARPVAIKLLTADGPDMERRFLVEAQVMAGFDHPHLVRVHDYAEAGGLCLLVMEHLPGGTLAGRIPRLSIQQSCAIGLAVADALDAVHQHGIVHRDIKPDNVLFTADGAVKVTDFGLAKLFEGTSVTTGAMLGTPAYVSPEQILGQQVGPATDVYSLGAVLYELLTGREPFGWQRSVQTVLQRHLDERPTLPAGMPPRIAAVVRQALEKDPAQRPKSAKEFALALAQAATRDLGPGWLVRAGMPLRVDDDVRAAAEGRRDTASSRDQAAPATTDNTPPPAGPDPAPPPAQPAVSPTPVPDETTWKLTPVRVLAALAVLGLLAAASIALGAYLGSAH
jgi:serine/threonine protein kinase